MPGKADATRQRLLDAALEEFAEYGIAGARVDRVAALAGTNKAQIYHYFGSKDQLFDAVFNRIVEGIVRETPIDAHDLPGYAAALARGYEAHPQVMRLATWQRLERADDPPVPLAVQSMTHKAEAIAKAQAEGVLPADFPPGVLLSLVLHLASVWTAVSPESAALVDSTTPDERARYVEDAVRRLISGGPGATEGRA
ncbi:TetR family transcriptional regulator [Herbidospora sp. NBRC 101105]|uniref:TetR family transcriptional regulator n=1 Tax=Herbidospora sp. NBRC 101105 TaxID=3032195 RepID=UPI0024A47768|nr:TetR family transcriptional regulator [Herbidospora sp. NBRC 101105]GLX96353.1 TetR family transcriptional regulator [Herbidospora sp. NBRC 101105]